MCRSWATGSQLTTHAWNKQCASRDMSSHWCFHYVFGNLQYSQMLATMHPRSGWRTRPLSKSSAVFPLSCVDLHILSLKTPCLHSTSCHMRADGQRWSRNTPTTFSGCAHKQPLAGTGSHPGARMHTDACRRRSSLTKATCTDFATQR